jgi:three-Cys-motif partner protein
MEPNLYIGREQTLVKHLILQKYLERFAHIIGSGWSTLTYVDCFSGPWNVRSNELKDSSFSIALNELRKARDTHAAKNKTVLLRCLFLEKDPDAFNRLKEFADGVTDAEVLPLNLELEEAVAEIVDFVKKGGSNSFPFVFIDPTGWTGFAMDVIKPLMQFKPGEVLINFMTGDIRRFATSPQQQTEQTFLRLFGSKEFKKVVEGLSGMDREDALVAEYRNIVAVKGDFKFTCSAIVLHPEFDRTRFHLIYATRHPKGVKVFKEAEKAAMQQMQQIRGDVQQRKHEDDTQRALLPDMWRDSSYFDSLRERYTQTAKNAIQAFLRERQHSSYDDAWELAMSFPLTWESDLRGWLDAWVEEKDLELHGMLPRQRVLQYGKGNVLLWKALAK